MEACLLTHARIDGNSLFPQEMHRATESLRPCHKHILERRAAIAEQPARGDSGPRDLALYPYRDRIVFNFAAYN